MDDGRINTWGWGLGEVGLVVLLCPRTIRLVVRAHHRCLAWPSSASSVRLLRPVPPPRARGSIGVGGPGHKHTPHEELDSHVM
jgi:hypothetical protein